VSQGKLFLTGDKSLKNPVKARSERGAGKKDGGRRIFIKHGRVQETIVQDNKNLYQGGGFLTKGKCKRCVQRRNQKQPPVREGLMEKSRGRKNNWIWEDNIKKKEGKGGYKFREGRLRIF